MLQKDTIKSTVIWDGEAYGGRHKLAKQALETGVGHPRAVEFQEPQQQVEQVPESIEKRKEREKEGPSERSERHKVFPDTGSH